MIARGVEGRVRRWEVKKTTSDEKEGHGFVI